MTEKQKKLHSLRDLKTALSEYNLHRGLELSEAGKHEDAVHCFDTLKNAAALDAGAKGRLKTSYYAHGKHMQREGKHGEALRCFSRIREVYPDDILLLERTKLLASYHEYRTIDNICEFRKQMGFGVISGGFEKYKHPFLEIARQKGILQEPERCRLPLKIDPVYR